MKTTQLIILTLFIAACTITPKSVIVTNNASLDNISEPMDSSPKPSRVVLFTEDFLSVAQWTKSVRPTIKDEALSSEDLLIDSKDSFSSRNGLEFSFDVKPLADEFIYMGFVVKFVEKTYSSNEAKVQIRADGSISYWIEGHCVATPKVETKSIQLDRHFHKITFRAHTDGSAEWLLDGASQMKRTNFDIGGDYSIALSGSKGDNPMLLDNMEVISLSEAAPSQDICQSVPHVISNPCPAGKCLSNGICCPSYISYYCEGYCYPSDQAAMSKSQGRCAEWKIVC